MSDLHKLLLNKVRQHEKALGIDPLMEELEPESELDLTSGNQASNFPPSTLPTKITPLIPPAVFPKSKSSSLSPPSMSAASNFIQSNYKDTVDEIFPVQDKYGAFQTYYHPPSGPDCPIFICHHGAGSSGITFAVLAKYLMLNYKEQRPDATPGVFTFDARGHGKSEKCTDFSLSTLTDDFTYIIGEFQKNHDVKDSSIYFLGHSLGGAVLTNYLTNQTDATPKVLGLIMLDIVEETAVKSLVAMPNFIKRRPRMFDSYQRAIDWHLKETHLLHNEESAKVSVPDLLQVQGSHLTWITDLLLTQPYWETWFKDLSSNFVTCGQGTAKLLILAGHENLDTDLIIGQMQGKYQLIVFNNNPNAGHFIHEDIPSHIAVSLLDFVRRNDSPEEYMKKELGFLPKWGGKINK